MVLRVTSQGEAGDVYDEDFDPQGSANRWRRCRPEDQAIGLSAGPQPHPDDRAGLLSINRATSSAVELAGEQLEGAAIAAADEIDRNLFERYGDVQAFAANPLVLSTPAEAAGIIDFLTATYGIYDLMVVADLSGDIIAVNSIDGAGESIDSRSLLGQNVSSENWFQVVRPGNTPAGGTFYTDAEYSSLVTAVYGEELVTLPFTAPIYDENGPLAAVWHNDASFDRIVTDLMNEVRHEFVETGSVTIETQVMREDGLVLDDADPSSILLFNLADAGAIAAGYAVNGHNG